MAKELTETKHHPTVEDNGIIHAGKTISGYKSIIGKNNGIGESILLTNSIDAGSQVCKAHQLRINKD